MASGRCRAPRWLKQPSGRGAYLVDWSRAALAALSYQQDSRAQPQALLLLGSGPLGARQMALAGREASENITGSAGWSPITGSVQWRGREGQQPQQDADDVNKDPRAHPPQENGSNTHAKDANMRAHGRKGKKKQSRGPDQGAPKQATAGDSAWIRPGPKVTRELILVGDNKVGNIADAVRETVNVPRAIGSLYSKKANAATAMRYIARYEEKARPIQRQYVVHVGLADALRRDPDAVTSALNATWTDRPDELIVCSIPEVSTRGGEIHAAIITANAQLKWWCRKNKHRFIDLTKGWRPEMLASHGLRYSTEGVHFVTAKINPILQAFLGQRPREPQKRPASPQPPPNQCQTQAQHQYRDNVAQTESGNREPVPEPFPPQQHFLQGSIPMHAPTPWGVTPFFPWGPHLSLPSIYNPMGEMIRQQTLLANRTLQCNTTTINVAFLNLNGARKASKLAELYTAISSEAVTLYAVAETHLRNLEEPPVHSGWQWAGFNRTGEYRKGGGVGVLWCNSSAWVPMAGPCEEHLWVSGSIVGIPVLVGVVCLTATRGHHEGNDRVMQCIIEDVQQWTPQYEILLLGDFNGHIQCIDGYQDRNGELSVRALRRIIREQEVRTISRGGTRRKQWWDQEVKQALEARRRANRAHRRAMKLSPTEDCRLAWEEYLRCKHYMQDVVQRKIAEHNHRQLQMITRVGRDSGRRFWSYVRGLDHKPPQHDLRDEATGLAVTDLPQHLTRHLQAVPKVMLPKGDLIPQAAQYRHLGVILTTEGDLLEAHEKHLKTASTHRKHPRWAEAPRWRRERRHFPSRRGGPY
ncbi:hypothetical protein HPB50_018522 [Hyalomma asiaticum]|uniref:Uncharacterized protein n=1 Tax=Hyalomma asiaticum TaxID=266040 RepID=A0ACB7TMK5_HYAAI|nr:hypothetical protein HPB50_018522 [Hyalomma asiaticum]